MRSRKFSCWFPEAKFFPPPPTPRKNTLPSAIKGLCRLFFYFRVTQTRKVCHLQVLSDFVQPLWLSRSQMNVFYFYVDRKYDRLLGRYPYQKVYIHEYEGPGREVAGAIKQQNVLKGTCYFVMQ